ncbi:GNAT family N-acetyltransferase [Rhizobium sp. PAMB 3182]
MPVPSLESSRLILRPHRGEDFEIYHALWTDPAVVRFITGKPSSEEESWARLLRVSGHWHHLGFGFWAIEEKETGRLIGEAGFLDMRRDMKPSLSGTVEAGWLLSSAAQGKGYGEEAMRTAFRWAKGAVATHDFSAIITPENLASIRLAEKLGFRRECDTQYRDSVVTLFRKHGAQHPEAGTP